MFTNLRDSVPRAFIVIFTVSIFNNNLKLIIETEAQILHTNLSDISIYMVLWPPKPFNAHRSINDDGMSTQPLLHVVCICHMSTFMVARPECHRQSRSVPGLFVPWLLTSTSYIAMLLPLWKQVAYTSFTLNRNNLSRVKHEEWF